MSSMLSSLFFATEDDTRGSYKGGREQFEKYDEGEHSEDEEEELFCNSLVKHPFSAEENVFGGFAVQLARKKKKASLCLGLLCVLMTLYFQALFANVMIPAISKDEWTEKVNVHSNVTGDYNLFEWWRGDAHRGSEVEDHAEVDAEVAQWTCTGEAFTYAEDAMDQLAKYTDAATPGATLYLGRLSKGQMFGIMAIAVWGATVLKTARNLGHYAMLLQMTAQCSEFDWSLRGNPICKASVVVIGVARLIINLMLGYEGIKFLAHTDNLKDFILNSVALAFVYELPELVHDAFASSNEKKLVSRVNKMGEDEESIGHVFVYNWVDHINGVFFLSLGVLIVYIGLNFIMPFSNMLDMGVYRQMCASKPGSNTIFADFDQL